MAKKKNPGFIKEHEQAIITSLAYVIGFTTAYIAFSGDYQTIDQAVSSTRNYSAIVEEAHGAENDMTKVVTTTEGLFVLRNGKERIVSLRDASETGPGYHRSIAAASASTDGRFVHYCAVMSADDDVCSHFVYAVETDTVHRVTRQGEPLDTSTAEALAGFWAPHNVLTVGSAVSRDAAAPWALQ